jgi:hypothetical protein
MNKVFTVALLAASLAAGTVLAQSVTPTTNGPAMGTTNNTTASGSATNTSASPPAIATPGVDSQTLAAPVAGANSFTEAQARDRLEAHGYTDVTGLRLDDQQIWRGKAMKNGSQVNVALDYQGNIVSQ